MEDIFDFGFTVVGADELDEVKDTQEEYGSLNKTLQERLTLMHDAIQPLLNNLKANPEKDYIKWNGAERIEKIEQFQKYINTLMNI